MVLAGCLGEDELQNGESDGDDDTDDTDDMETDPINVGGILPFSGDLSDFGGPMVNGLQLAIEDINAAGGPLGREVELFTEDTATDSTQGVNGANSLLDTNDVSCLIGAVSSAVTISIATSAAVPNETLQITPASSSPTITTLDDDGLVYRTRTNDRFVARVMARIIENEGVDRAAVVFIENDFGLALAETFESVFDGAVTGTIGYEPGETSYRAVLDEAFSEDPEMIAFAGYPESGTTMLSQWAEEGYGGNWVLHTSMLSEDVIENVGADIINRMYGVRTLPPTGGATDSFVDAYETEFPDDQVFSPYSWNSYDALLSYALAVHHAGTTDSQVVKESMRPVTNPPGEEIPYGEFGTAANLIDEGTDIAYSGPSGNVNYDENGDVASDMVIVEVQDGEFVDTETIPAEDLV